MQKSPFIPEIGRFRNYVADKYRKKSVYTTQGETQEDYLSFKTIYLIEEIFNDSLPAVLARKGRYFDELENQEYHGERDNVVELFNHDSWFIQTELLPEHFKDELMYVLSVFAPWYRKNRNDRFIEIPENDVVVQKHKILTRIIRRLEAATQDKEVNVSVDLELDYERYIERMMAEAEQDRERRIEAEQRASEANLKAVLAEQTISEMVKMLHSLGVNLETISEKTGKSIAEIKQMVGE